MIMGVGIDIVENIRISRVVAKYEKGFLRKVLHSKEQIEYNNIKVENKRIQYLTSRWAVKEALVKAIGNKSIVYSNVYLDKEPSGKPIIKIDKHVLDPSNSPFQYIKEKEEREERENEVLHNYEYINRVTHSAENGFLCSISHEEHFSTAVVIHTKNVTRI
mmetsp:Transcript_33536/g.34842  ORF Transcript_33536/g.34842 Transcript_33536/m.34842 type:complete len:161 (+) Transcript_33536:8-490(+)